MTRKTIGTWAKGWDTEHDGSTFLPTNALDAAAWIIAKVEAVPAQYRDKVEIKLTGSEDGTGIDDVTITMSYETAQK